MSVTRTKQASHQDERCGAAGPPPWKCSEVDVQIASTAAGIPNKDVFACWANAALNRSRDQRAVTLRIVDELESTELNGRYRGKWSPTNVLSFPFEPSPGVEVPLLGDIVICAPVVAREAAAQGKDLLAHWAHMVVHGALHLLGHDHQTTVEAKDMEERERSILGEFGFPDPYL